MKFILTLLLSGFFWLSAPIAPQVHAQEVLPGIDIFETPAGMTTWVIPPIPEGFFDPGSSPFTGVICLQGEGGTDTVVRRFDAMLLDGPPETIPIEIVALNLVSCDPVTVTYPDRVSELWDVRVTLSNLTPQQQGQMTVTKTHPNGGTFDSFLPVQPHFTFTRVGNPLERGIDCGTPFTTVCPPYQFQTRDVPWTYEPCHPEMLRIPGVTSNFCPSSTGSGRVKTMATDGFSTHAYLPTHAPIMCGNAIVEPPEQCDDGNNVSGDGCGAACTLECGGLTPTIVGTSGNDLLIGTNGMDVIVGLAGDDVLRGGNGDDVLCGNDGEDTLEGGNGNDQLFGNDGEDALKGENGDDVVCGGGGNDGLSGGRGADRMDGNTGSNANDGGNGSDICINGAPTSCENTTTPVPECAP